MIKYFMFLSFILSYFMLSSCASSESYNTASFRNNSYVPPRNMVALNQGGLSAEQIRIISSTKPPEVFPIDIAVIFIEQGYMEADLRHILRHGIIKELKEVPQIRRITIIPDFIIPRDISFAAIQELGIRSLSELTIVFYVDSSEIFQKYEFMKGDKIKIASTMDYMIVDSYTSAILTTDKLYTEKIYNDEAFKSGEEKKAFEEVLKEQSVILVNSIKNLFKKSDNNQAD